MTERSEIEAGEWPRADDADRPYAGSGARAREVVTKSAEAGGDELERNGIEFAARIDCLARRLMAMRRHARSLEQHAGAALGSVPLADQPDPVEDLLAALEELNVAQEELLAQHREIGASRLALRAERERYAELFEFAPDAYLVTDGAGVIREANRAASDLLGVAKPALPGKLLINYVVDGSKRPLRTFLLGVTQSCRDEAKDERRELSLVLRPRGAAALDASATVAPVRNRDGQCVGMRWLLRDVSDRVRAEREIRRVNEELERRVADRTAQLELRSGELEIANRAKSDFLAVMSHELRTPLQAILGFADLMRTDIPESMPDYARKWADHIHRAAEHLLGLVEQILRFSRLEAGREIVHAERVDLGMLVKELVHLVEPAARLKGVSLTVNMPVEHATIRSDLGKLRQIVFNLLANAVKFTERGTIEVESRRSGDRIQLEVRDTGIGIAPEHLERVFDQFWQAECRPTAGKGGTGLGLSIARHLARLIGGDLTVESAVGSGSVFRLDIPAELALPV